MERMAAVLQISVENRQVAAPAPPVDQGTKPFNPLFASIRERHRTIDEGLLQEIFEKKNPSLGGSLWFARGFFE
jgi:hypothetical protein